MSVSLWLTYSQNTREWDVASERCRTRTSIKLQSDDKQVYFYTGLPSYSVFVAQCFGGSYVQTFESWLEHQRSIFISTAPLRCNVPLASILRVC